MIEGQALVPPGVDSAPTEADSSFLSVDPPKLTPSETRSKEASPEQHTTARVERACERCRRLRVRCSGNKPCSRCSDSGVPDFCAFPPRTFAESLKHRSDACENVLRSLATSQLVIQLGINLDAILNIEDVGKQVEELEAATATLRQPAEPPPRARNSSTPKPEVKIHQGLFYGPGGSITWARQALQQISPSMPTLEPYPSLAERFLANYSKQTDITSHMGIPSPASPQFISLLDAYWRHVHPVAPILHPPSFQRAIDSNLLETNRTFYRLALLVLALGARFVEPSRTPTLVRLPGYPHPVKIYHPGGRSYFHQALALRPSTFCDPMDLLEMQCAGLEAFWLMGGASYPMVWAAVGVAIRHSINVGAHSEIHAHWSADPLNDQLRRRSFHFLLFLDRVVSTTLGRPMTLAASDFDLGLPADVTDEELDHWSRTGIEAPLHSQRLGTPLSGCLLLWRIQEYYTQGFLLARAISSKTISVEESISQIRHFDSALNLWLDSVPEHLIWNAEQRDPKWTTVAAVLRISFYACQIIVHRELLEASSDVAIPLPSKIICSNAGKSSAHVFQRLQQRDLLDDVFWFAPHQCFTVAITLLTIQLNTASQQPKLSPDIACCVEVCQILARSTYEAKQSAVMLHEVVATSTTDSDDSDDDDDEMTGTSLASGLPLESGYLSDELPSPGPAEGDHQRLSFRPGFNPMKLRW
ncbi:hypothetical protein T439DRAFT_344757 [Meredithblackwellia eburnea MCA 4105]